MAAVQQPTVRRSQTTAAGSHLLAIKSGGRAPGSQKRRPARPDIEIVQVKIFGPVENNDLLLLAAVRIWQ